MKLYVGNNKRRISRVLLTFILLSLFTGCCERVAQTDQGTLPVESGRIVTDDLGREVSLPFKIERAISLAPSLTEMIFAVGAGDRLVGVTTYCNYPEEAKAIRKVGDTITPNIESIVALKPDVVFVSTASQLEAFAKTLDEQGIAVYVITANSLEDVYQNLISLGELFSTSESTVELVSQLKSRTENPFIPYSGSQFVPLRVFVQVSNDPLFTIGKESFLTEVVEKASGVSVTKDVPTAYPKLSKETALALNPDVIILSDSEDNKEPNVVFKDSPAVKNGRVYRINADIISRPGPRLVDAIEQIAGFLHGYKN
ncbi:MAG: cobalamin-binding protein [Pyrinomonadaceae bacterium]